MLTLNFPADSSQDTVRSFVRDLSGMEVQEAVVLTRNGSRKRITSGFRPKTKIAVRANLASLTLP